jgi:hypothetical protein
VLTVGRRFGWAKGSVSVYGKHRKICPARREGVGFPVGCLTTLSGATTLAVV